MLRQVKEFALKTSLMVISKQINSTKHVDKFSNFNIILIGRKNVHNELSRTALG